MSTGYEKGSKGWQSLTEFFAILKKYGVPEDSDGYWEHLAADACKYDDKYKDDAPLAHYIIEAFLTVQEHEIRGRHTRDEMLKAECEAKKEMEKRMYDRIRREICET